MTAPRTKDADLRQLAQDAAEGKGWVNIRPMTMAAVKALKNCLVRAKTRSGKEITVRYPRVDVYLKSKMGRMDTTLRINERAMAALAKRVLPESLAKIEAQLNELLDGIMHTIESISEVTCQATGLLGARRFHDRGWVRTLHPSVIRKLRLKESASPIG